MRLIFIYFSKRGGGGYWRGPGFWARWNEMVDSSYKKFLLQVPTQPLYIYTIYIYETNASCRPCYFHLCLHSQWDHAKLRRSSHNCLCYLALCRIVHCWLTHNIQHWLALSTNYNNTFFRHLHHLPHDQYCLYMSILKPTSITKSFTYSYDAILEQCDIVQYMLWWACYYYAVQMTWLAYLPINHGYQRVKLGKEENDLWIHGHQEAHI